MIDDEVIEFLAERVLWRLHNEKAGNHLFDPFRDLTEAEAAELLRDIDEIGQLVSAEDSNGIMDVYPPQARTDEPASAANIRERLSERHEVVLGLAAQGWAMEPEAESHLYREYNSIGQERPPFPWPRGADGKIIQ